MKIVLILLVFIQFSLANYAQIVADHTVVDKYDKIPQHYIDEVKKMLVDIAGESHSSGYRNGMNLLELINPVYQVTTYDGTPPAYSTSYLRLGRHGEVGEEDFYTTQTAINAYKSVITNQYNTGNPFSVMGFGWCWDMTWTNGPGGTKDPVYNVRWAGSSDGGPNGNLRWGLDSGDGVLTGNTVCMDTYLNAVEQYIQLCTTNNYPTKIIFTTGPVDNQEQNLAGTENGFQREIKQNYIRSYVAANSNRILFDYADILCWNNSGVKYITNWNDGGTIRPHANIHPDNMMDYDASWNLIPHTEDGDHIGEVGTVRLAKAMWWLLARIAGWDGGTTGINNVETKPELPSFIERTRNEIRLKLDQSTNLPVTVSIYDFYGHCIDCKKTVSNSYIFNISNLPSGIYLVVLSGSTGNKTQKIIIP
jgi:hypothetical protein